MTTTELDKIFDKIARLRALEASPGTPEEAAAAAAAVQRLAFRYNLSLKQIESAIDSGAVGINRYWVEMELKPGSNYIWKQKLFQAICQTNFCREIYNRVRTPNGTSSFIDGVWVVGEEHNVRIVTDLYDYLRDTLLRLVDQYWKDIREDFDRPSNYAVHYKSGFLAGAVDTITQRLQEQYEAQRKETNETTALVLVKDGELDTAVSRLFVGIDRKKSKQELHPGAYIAGVIAGKKVNLARQIEEG